jgi:hypothetical protein
VHNRNAIPASVRRKAPAADRPDRHAKESAHALRQKKKAQEDSDAQTQEEEEKESAQDPIACVAIIGQSSQFRRLHGKRLRGLQKDALSKCDAF